MVTKEQIIDYIKRTPENTNVNVLSGMLDGLTESSSSLDLSTAQVTLIGSPNFTCGIPACDEDGTMAGITVTVHGNDTFTVPLWKGHLFLIFENSSAKVSGDAELIYGGAAVDIYGDCIIEEI